MLFPRNVLPVAVLSLSVSLLVACASEKKDPTTNAAATISTGGAVVTSNATAKDCQPLVPNRDLHDLTGLSICTTSDTSVVKIKYYMTAGKEYCVFPSNGVSAPITSLCFITEASGEVNLKWPSGAHNYAYLTISRDRDAFVNALSGMNNFPDYAAVTRKMSF